MAVTMQERSPTVVGRHMSMQHACSATMAVTTHVSTRIKESRP